MLNNNIFYHSITRKIIVAFGSLFSNIRIARKKKGGVFSITVKNQGNGYTSPPTVTITGGGGVGATAVANLGSGGNSNKVVSITVVSSGTDYVSQPTVTISSPTTGTTATAVAVIDPIVQTLNIPITYAPKEKWLVRTEQDPGLNYSTYGSFPRMSFEITGITYDASRKMNRMSTITCGDGTDNMKKVYSPVPYNIDISLYIITKTQEDAFQIAEQILPYFTPEYMLSIKSVSESNIVMDVPVILNGVSIDDDYEGDFETRRFVTYTLTFTLKTHMFGPVLDGSIITRTLVDVANPNQIPISNYDANGNTSNGNVTENWDEF